MTCLIDYTARLPREEIIRAFQKTYASWDQIGSLAGRRACLLKVGVHLLGIVAKPLYYLGIGVLGRTVIPCTSRLSADALMKKKEYESLLTLREHRELRNRVQSFFATQIFCAPAAIFSQIIQVFKAAAGVIYPGFYFAKDELTPAFRRLEAIAKQVHCSPELIERLGRGSTIVHSSLSHFPYSEYYYAQFKSDFEIIANKLESQAISDHHKFMLLSMLNPEPKGSGIEACPAGLGRILQQIRTNLELPENPLEVIPWLIGQLKEEVIHAMVLQAQTTRFDNDRPTWHRIIDGLAHDPAHRGNGLILAIGKQVGLSQETISRSGNDFTVHRLEPLSEEALQGLLQAFHAQMTPDQVVSALMDKINSQPDGSPGLKGFREHMTRTLAVRLGRANPLEQDPAMGVVRQYYLSQGIGDPADEGFTNFNRQGIDAYLQIGQEA